MIIGFLRSPRWKTPVMSFIDEYCTVFDDEDENKLEFTKIHNVSIQANPACLPACYPFALAFTYMFACFDIAFRISRK